LLFLKSSLAVALGFGLWWIYFDFIARRPPKNGVWLHFVWSYLHLPLVMAIVATGAGIANIIGHQEAILVIEVQQLVSGSVGTVLIVMAFLEITLHREENEPTHNYLSPLLKLVAGLLAFIIGWKGGISDPLMLLLALIGLVVFQMMYGLWVWFNQDIGDPADSLEEPYQ
jgi:low temperature requirement protein LtrA